MVTTVDTLFERLIDALRRAWRGGPHLRDDVDMALRLLRGLQPRVGATHEIAATLAEVISDLEQLPAEQTARRERIERTATRLKAAKPHFGLSHTGPEIGKLNAALGEKRTGRPAPAKAAHQPGPVTPLPPSASITQLPRVGPKVAQKLEKLGIVTIEDALRFAPRRHIDYSRTTEIGSPFVITGDVTVEGDIVEIQQHFGTRPRVTARIFDGTGTLRLTWFNTFIAKQLTEGDHIFASGTIQGGYNGLQMTSPEWEKADGQGLSTGRLIPVYPATQGIAQKTLRSITRTALDVTRNRLVDWLAEATPYLDDAAIGGLPALEEAYEHLHYPDTLDQFTAARARFSFENLLLLQLGLVKRKRDRKSAPGQRFEVNNAVTDAFRAALPFPLTRAQNTALGEIVRDLQRNEPMTRLLQGDVGSGKTVVAATIALIAGANGKQTAIMAPTELLAEQHEQSLTGLYSRLPEGERPRIALLTGSTRAAARREITVPLESGEIDILIGTHSLIQESVAFHDLGLVVIDEQHRFGVRQRGLLTAKANGIAPHVLSMTATPIPRTLNLVLTGDLDVSVIDERPPGRIRIETQRFVGQHRADAYALVRQEIATGHQAFVICPLVEESEMIEARSAIEEAERLQRDVFPDLRIEVLHGRMSGKRKDEVMTAFRNHDFDILVSTSVIEVGIDIPNATVMMIEGADRFGLSQLHQFRGRVGRGGAKSHCLLLADEVTGEGEARLETMVATDDGFVLAERDLELRGPGDFIGTRQSGLPELGWLEPGFDTRLLDAARRAAERIVQVDPNIDIRRFPHLKARLQQFWATATPVDATKA